MSKILVTGGGGFIGSNLLDRLLEFGHDCVIMDNFSTGRVENLLEGKMGDSWYAANLTPLDVSDYVAVYNGFRHFKPEIVVHCAASYKDPNNWVEDARTNVVGTAAICMAAKKYGVDKIIYLQTSLCYGMNPPNGTGIYSDPYKGPMPIPINCPINPTPDSYAITKTAGERLIAMSGVPFVSFRLSNCYGPRNFNGAIPAIYKKLKNNEIPTIVKTMRCFIYMSDLVDLLVRAINGEGKRNYYHVSSGTDNSILDVYREIISNPIKDMLSTQGGYTIPTVKEKAPHEVGTLLLDPTETFEDFPGWRPRVSLEEGIKKSVEWYENNPIDEVYTHLGKRD